ncbi:helix-turn-helix domain-containing protein, partial [bacterium]|nr:helix-turn-helix domain-containing protein [bacterium]
QSKSSDSKSEVQTNVDNNFQNDILTSEEVAQYLRKSLSWVYKNWNILGGRKLGGSLIFPKKEDLLTYLYHFMTTK